MIMEFMEMSAEAYAGIFQDVSFVYGAHQFNLLNARKCEKVYYLCARSKKFRLGIVGGKLGSVFASPFSAPFGGFVFSGEHMHMAYVDEAISLFVDWVKCQGMDQIKIVMPPFIYQETVISKVTNSLLRNGFSIAHIDLNYYLSMDAFVGDYDRVMHHSARKNLKKALDHNLQFSRCQQREEKVLAYEIIRQNRAAKGYPLKMSMADVMNTADIIESDFFLVRNESGSPVASAIVFHVTDTIVQVIYWGNLPEYSHLRSVNFLAFRLFDFYKSAGKKMVDVGPSSEHSIPNYGLCDFKDSLGCEVGSKLSLIRYIPGFLFSVLCQGARFAETILFDNCLMLPV